MSRAVWLCRASLLAAAVVVACGTDTIELLPTQPVGVGGSASGAGGTASSPAAGAPNGGSPEVAGASGATLGGSASGSGGAFGGCSGFGCGGFGSGGGFGGDGGECKEFEFCPCGPQDRCGPGTKCNLRLGWCTPECDNPLECPGEGSLCEDHSCGTCTEDDQCEKYGGFGRRVCVNQRCEECEGPSDCPEDEPMCVGRRCIQCMKDEDCPSGVCNEPRGRCEK